VKLIAFCEAPGDFRLVSGLVDRALWETGLAWVVDNLETPDVVRTWQADGFGNDFIDIHDLNRLSAGGWRLAAGGWRLAAGGWRLAALGGRLSAGGSRLSAGGSRRAA
jgi:hypothetical protein